MSAGFWFMVSVPKEEYERKKLTGQWSSATNNLSKDYTALEIKENDQPECEISGDGSVRINFQFDDKDFYGQDQLPLEKVLRRGLEELEVVDAVWTTDQTDSFRQVYFPCKDGFECETLLTGLTAKGIGLVKESTLGLLPCSIFYRDKCTDYDQKHYNDSSAASKIPSEQESFNKTKSDIKKALKGFRFMQKKFLESVTSRLTVAQVVVGVRAGAEMTFDFVMFVILASMIAALGLLENSTVMIVASMLISPIMGPIMAWTFGSVINDTKLRNQGIRSEIIGLLVCLLLGFFIGLVWINTSDTLNHGQWPTQEMASRGQGRGLWVGILFALPSGAGVALSILGGNAGSLVGVAISASLLPPAVNAGLLWALASVKGLQAVGEIPIPVTIGNISHFIKPSLIPPAGYTVSYSYDLDKECGVLGVVSLVLTFLNIACIFIASFVVLKIKEVAPNANLPTTSRFWQKDVKIARDFNKKRIVAKPEELGTQFLVEWATLNGVDPNEILGQSEEAKMKHDQTLRDIVQEAESDEVYRSITSHFQNRSSVPLSQRLSSISWTEGKTYKIPEAARENNNRPNDSNGMDSVNLAMDLKDDPELRSVQLRHPEQGFSKKKLRNTEILRQSLLSCSANPFSLWPSQSPRTTSWRFPTPEVPGPSRLRYSPPLNIVHETNC